DPLRIDVAVKSGDALLPYGDRPTGPVGRHARMQRIVEVLGVARGAHPDAVRGPLRDTVGAQALRVDIEVGAAPEVVPYHDHAPRAVGCEMWDSLLIGCRANRHPVRRP